MEEIKKAANEHDSINPETLLNACNELLRNSEAHMGMGDIRLTMENQKALCEVVKKQFFNQSVRCEQLLAFCLWLQKEKGGRIEGGKEEEIIAEWVVHLPS